MDLTGIGYVFFNFKFPLKASEFNVLFYRGFKKGVAEGLELRAKTGSKEILEIHPGSAFIMDSLTQSKVVKFNLATVNELDTTSFQTAKTRVIAYYEYEDNTTIANTIIVDIINPLGPYPTNEEYLILGDLTYSGGEIESIDYSQRTYSNINEDLFESLLPSNIGIRYSAVNQIKLAYNNASKYGFSKYKLENVGNIDPSTFETEAGAWNVGIATSTRYFVFLVLDTDLVVKVKIYSETDADWNQTTGVFDGLNIGTTIYPQHKFIGEFWTDSGSNIVLSSFYDSYINHPRGDIKMFSGLNGASAAIIPLGWQLCDGSNGAPDLRSRFIKGYDDLQGANIYTSANVGTVASTPLGTMTFNVADAADLLAWMNDHTMDTLVGKEVEINSVWYEIKSEAGGTVVDGVVTVAPTSITFINTNPTYAGAPLVYSLRGSNLAVRDKGGESKHRLVENELASHTHTAVGGSSYNYCTIDVAGSDWFSPVGAENKLKSAALSTSNLNTGSDYEHENNPLYYVLIFAIKI